MKQIIRTSLIVLFFAVGLTATAQHRLTFGVKSGYVFSNINGYKQNAENVKGRMAYTGGLTFDYALNNPKIFISSGVEFANKGGQFDYVVENVEMSEKNTFLKTTISSMYIQVPLHLGYKFEMSKSINILVQGGPYAAYGVSGHLELGENVEIDNPNGTTIVPLNEYINNVNGFHREISTFKDGVFKEFDYGVGAAATVVYEHVSLGFKYDLGLANISENTDKVKNRNAYLTLGYRF